MKINKVKLTNLIAKRIEAIPKAIINDAIGIICADLLDNIIEGKSVSISNFGTLDVHIFSGHNGTNIASGKVEYVKPFKSVKFVAHENFKYLIKQKRKI